MTFRSLTEKKMAATSKTKELKRARRYGKRVGNELYRVRLTNIAMLELCSTDWKQNKGYVNFLLVLPASLFTGSVWIVFEEEAVYIEWSGRRVMGRGGGEWSPY